MSTPSPSPPFELAAAQVRDASKIAQMSRDLVEPGLGWSWRTGRVSQQLKSPRGVNLVALDAKRRIIGFALLSLRERRGHLLLCAVEPKWRRHGVGRALLRRTQEIATLMELEQLQLEVRAQNQGAQAFYASLGFQIAHRLKGYYHNQEDALLMIKRLEAAPVQGLRPGMTLQEWLMAVEREQEPEP